jgi:hypothetical protein
MSNGICLTALLRMPKKQGRRLVRKLLESPQSGDDSTSSTESASTEPPSPRYVLRYFFDCATGTCLWAGDQATAAAFDYPVDLYMLNLPESLSKFGDQLIDRWTVLYDQKRISKSNPEFLAFCEDARQLLTMLREYLGAEFEVLDESGVTAIFPDSSEPTA